MPRVRTPITRLAKPIAIPAYISESPIYLLSLSKKSMAVVGADTLTSFEP